MATRYVSIADVRGTCGITQKFISDEDLTTLCEQAEYNVEKILNVSFTPVTFIDTFTGNGTERQVLRRNPVLKVRALNIDSTAVTPDYLRIDKQPGIIWLTSSAESTYFKSNATERNLCRVKYDTGLLEETSTQTTLTAASLAGNTVTVAVSSSTGFTADSYVEIQGLDGRIETAKISSIPGLTGIIFDNLSQTHENGSLLTLQQVPKVAERIMLVYCSLEAVSRVVGQSFDEITGYDLGEMHVQKGEPYTQWRETATQLTREYNQLLQSFRLRPSVR